jgi:hypothetical protein
LEYWSNEKCRSAFTWVELIGSDSRMQRKIPVNPISFHGALIDDCDTFQSIK